MEEVKISNEQNIKNLKKRKILRYVIIVLAFATIILGLLDLFYQRTILLIITIALFVLVTILQNYRDSIKIIRHDDLADVRKEIEENKKKFKTNAEVIKDKNKEESKTPKKTTSNKSKTTSNKPKTNSSKPKTNGSKSNTNKKGSTNKNKKNK
jgi:low affinity Fe/Cu permease